MRVYFETNFLMELVRLQEQCVSCEEILRLGEAGRIQIRVPAYSLAEPHETLGRSRQNRTRIKADLDRELKVLAKTTSNQQQLADFERTTALLIESTREEARGFNDLRTRLLEAVNVIPLDASILEAAAQAEEKHGLSGQDAIVYASVLFDLQTTPTGPSCFLNKNSRDFDDPDILARLAQHGCKLITSFDEGYRYISSQLINV